MPSIEIPIEKKEEVTPSEKQKKFSTDLMMKVIEHVVKEFKSKNWLSAYLVSWALIEEVMFVELLQYVAKHLKINIPKALWDKNQETKNMFYYAITHDEEMYKLLEAGRKERNHVVHELIDTLEAGSMDKKLKKDILYNMENIIKPLYQRMCGEIQIPSLTLYVKGWNDALSKTVEALRKE
jgi:hypothetical protein